MYQTILNDVGGDFYHIHQQVMAMFPPDLPNGERVLFYQNGRNVIVQSHTQPSSGKSKPQLPTYESGDVVMFQLRANPVIKKSRSTQRVKADPGDWIERQGKRLGFDVLYTNIVDQRMARARKNGRTITLYVVDFDGMLQVTDENLFMDAIKNGIGRAKGFGCGLLRVNKLGE